MPVTRGGTISADAENKHKGRYPIFLFDRLRSQGSVILKCQLVSGELELNPESVGLLRFSSATIFLLCP